eukprot:8477452-Ditylum_brightwellii.AAC.1
MEQNVINERGAPCQIMLASMDANYNILMVFGLALEVMLDFCKGGYGEFVFCPGGKITKTMKKLYY